MGSTSLPLCVSMTTADISPLQLPPCGHSKVASQFTRCHQAVTATSTGNMACNPIPRIHRLAYVFVFVTS